MNAKLLILSCLFALALGFEDKSVYQYLVDNGFSTLVGALQSAGLTSRLDGSGPFTIFAPTNAALSGVNISRYTGEQLATMFSYHVINEFVLVPMVNKVTNKTTLEGQDLTVEPSGNGLLINGKARVDGAKSDIIVNNGVVQPVDMLLSPPVFVSDNIYQVLVKDNVRFRDLTLALLLSDLVSTLEASEFTLFAPTDAAFDLYMDSLLDPTAPDSASIYHEVMKYHFVPGARRSNQLSNGQRLYTLHGTSVNVTVSSGVKINNANVVEADIMASNGVIHAIDNVLIPTDIWRRR